MDWLKQQDPVEIIFAVGIVAAGIYAMHLQNDVVQGMCLGAACMYVKGKISPNVTAPQ